MYGLGTCALRLRARSPSTTALLGVGVTAADVTALRTVGGDAWVPQGRAALIVRGHATKDGAEKRFSWAFRRGVTLHDCGTVDSDAGVPTTALQLGGGDALDLTVSLAPEELFRLAEGADRLLFEPFAAADANGDGEITLDELAQVAASVGDAGDAGADGGDAGLEDAGAHDGGHHDGGVHEADAGDSGTSPPTGTPTPDLLT